MAIFRSAALLAAVLMFAFAGAAHAAGVETFYKGRTVFVLVGYPPGGGYDLYARVLAKHMGKYIPGRPVLVVQNMPGAGSLKAANYLYAVAPKDGSMIGTFSRSAPIAPLFGQAPFDSSKFTWIGSVSNDVTVCISWSASPIQSWQDALAREFIVGGDGADSDPDIYARLYKNVFGAKLKLITGFPGTRDITLAMERREVDGLCGISWSTLKSQHAEWIAGGKIRILIQAADQREPDLAQVPLAGELTRDAEKKQVLDFIIRSQAMARPFAAPPGIPAERMAALRAAFDRTMKDPAFLGDAKKAFLDVRPLSGAGVEALVRAAYATPKPVIAKARAAIRN
jgi:tripartite-type tricarboxylate transporter receptor subunit TctC